jgi:5-carboxymethyl-2-hydroxymuconate isomerase
MRLVTYRNGRTESLGVVVDGHTLPVAEFASGGPATMAELLDAGDGSLKTLRRAAVGAEQRIAAEGRRLDELELLPPVTRPGKIVAIGLNYRDHAKEAGATPPTEPIVFAKFVTSLIGHRAEIRWDPELSHEVDYEAELAVVIGRRARRVSEEDALDYVLGYTCANDVSARDIQFSESQWVRAKSLDTFCPLGPVLVTADEIPDPQRLPISCMVNGELMQSANTSEMFFGVRTLISYCSRSFTLESGDVIITGTPAGVGVFKKPQRWLGEGDEVAVEIGGIGSLVNTCRNSSPSDDARPGL